jgi:hypothetical protein
MFELFSYPFYCKKQVKMLMLEVTSGEKKLKYSHRNSNFSLNTMTTLFVFLRILFLLQEESEFVDAVK